MKNSSSHEIRIYYQLENNPPPPIIQKMSEFVKVPDQYNTNVDYKIDHISKIKYCNKRNSGNKKSVSEHYTSFNQRLNFERPYLKN